jgi:hypothetical protein
MTTTPVDITINASVDTTINQIPAVAYDREDKVVTLSLQLPKLDEETVLTGNESVRTGNESVRTGYESVEKGSDSLLCNLEAESIQGSASMIVEDAAGKNS